MKFKNNTMNYRSLRGNLSTEESSSLITYSNILRNAIRFIKCSQRSLKPIKSREYNTKILDEKRSALKRVADAKKERNKKKAAYKRDLRALEAREAELSMEFCLF